METVLKIEGMSCKHCVKHITEALKEIGGVNNVTVSLEEKTATVVSDIPIEQAVFAAAIDEAGYDLVD